MIKRNIAILTLLIVTVGWDGSALAAVTNHSQNAEIPIIDAHSQIPFQAGKLKKVIRLMDKGGIACVILSSKGPLTAKELVSFALQHPGRILPAVRTKCSAYRENKVEGFEDFLKKQLNMPTFGAMAEVLLYHAQKGINQIRAPEVIVFPDDQRVQSAFKMAQIRNWPLILHIEFKRAGSLADAFMTKLEALLDKHPNYPFLLIHMGQLNHSEVQRLILAHTNIYFITSHSTYITASPIAEVRMADDFRTNMFDGKQLTVQWKRLLEKYPERFVLGFDNVWPEHWSQYYLDQIKIWREVLKLPCSKLQGIFPVRYGSILISLANPAASCGECARMLVQGIAERSGACPCSWKCRAFVAFKNKCYAERCTPAVKIPAPITAVPPQRLNHFCTPVLLIVSRS